jgi:aflatoxin B1 aldehyde reductase
MGGFYSSVYGKDEMLAAARLIEDAAKTANISPHAVALRWVANHSLLSAEHGDGVVMAASNIQQLSENIDALEAGPLPGDLVELLNGIWEKVEPFSAPYHT